VQFQVTDRNDINLRMDLAETRSSFSGWLDTRERHPPFRPVRREVLPEVVSYDAPGLQIMVHPSRVDSEVSESSITICAGTARRTDTGSAMSALDIGREIDSRGCTTWDWLRGRFAIIHVELRTRSVTFITDRFGVYNICYLPQGDIISFSDRADAVPSLRRPELDAQAIYDYIYFHVIPSPRTVFRDVCRLEPAQVVRFSARGLDKSTWWQPQFEPDVTSGIAPLKSRFLELLHDAVGREITTERIGSFLSGGTDSSTVAGILGKITGQPAQTFSMGFDAAGYDEMSYARIAARHFGTEQHEYYLTPEDLVQGIPTVAASFDQPFGNSSALPAYYCARYANEAGIEKLLAGDGGDELFGGNSRYAKQKVFELYRSLPVMLRTAILEPSLLGQQWPRRVPLLRKLASYIEQARVPMPDRMETYNLLTRFGADQVFTDRFLTRVQESEPVSLQREIYTRQHASSLIDRMLAYDWRFTLADNDLPKVIGASRLAGEAVGFPLLDDDLVDFSLRLAPSLKVHGLTLRYFFKEALKGFLPVEIIRKRKHGFGLPFGPWLVQHEPLQTLARTALDRIVARGLVRREFVQELFSIRLREHAGYFGEMIWVLMMLEEWLQAKAPEYAV
jgi:asparagine synthase (glutamine-hydrolysing)